MSTDDNAFRRVDWPRADGWVPSDDDDEQGLPLRARGPGLSDADLELLTLAARALGAVRVEVVDGEQWVNLHFSDGSVINGWNSLLFYGDTFELQVRLRLSVDVRDECAVVAPARPLERHESQWPKIEEFTDNEFLATARAVTRAAAEIAVAKENKQA